MHNMLKMYSVTKRKVYLLLHHSESETKWYKIISSIIILLIILNTAAVILETVQSIYESNKVFFRTFEIITIIIFSAEYILRVWSCTSSEKYKHPIWGRLKYIFSMGAIIDLIAILPFYIPLVLMPTVAYSKLY